MSEERESPPPSEPEDAPEDAPERPGEEPSDEGGEEPGEDEAAGDESVPAPEAEAAASDDALIVARGLTKYYGYRAAVRDISFEIGEGEIVGFLGLNGAGKTTTLRMLSCLLVPTAGTVTIAGLDVIGDAHEIRKRIGYLPETPPVYHEMTVASYVHFAARLRGLDEEVVRRRVPEVLEITRTVEVAGQVIGTLSTGYRQRVGIAQAVVHQPELLILDEPFAGLDPVQTVEMREMIRGLGGRHTVLLSSHLLSQIHRTCDRILVIQRGEIVAQGSEEELAAMLPARLERFELEVRGAEAEIRAALDGLEEVESLEVSQLGEGLARLTVSSQKDVREAVAAALVGEGIGLRSLGRLLPELETVFVELARGDGKKEASP